MKNLEEHDLEMDEADESSATAEYLHAEALVIGWLFSNRTKEFSPNGLAEELGVSSYMVQKVMRTEIGSTLFHTSGSGHKQKYESCAPELPPTILGELEVIQQEIAANDALGAQARIEFWFRANKEFEGMMKYKVIRKY